MPMSGIAALILLASLAQVVEPGSYGPRTYRSPSGEYELLVDPLARRARPLARQLAARAAALRLRKAGAIEWETLHSCRLSEAIVTDRGEVCGYGVGPGSGILGDLLVLVLRPGGEIRAEHTWPRRAAHHRDPEPTAIGLLHEPGSATFAVRVVDERAHDGREAWWRFEIATGQRAGEVVPADGLAADPNVSRKIEDARVLPGTGLVLVHWRRTDVAPLRSSAEFALVDAAGATVALFAAADEGAAPLEVSAGGSFALALPRARERVDARAVADPATPSGWKIEVLRRHPLAPAIEIGGEPAAPPIELALVARVHLDVPHGGLGLGGASRAAFDPLGRALVRDAHSGAVSVFAPDGRWIATVPSDPFAKAWPETEGWLAGTAAGDVLVWSKERGEHVRFDGAGRESGAVPVAAALCPEAAGDRLWSLGPGSGAALRDREGALLRTVERRAAAAAAAPDGTLFLYSHALLACVAAEGARTAEIAVPAISWARPAIAASRDWVVLHGERGPALLFDRRSGALSRWEIPDLGAGATAAIGFAPDGALVVLTLPGLTCARYRLP